jgi:deazaflavin-dependent oxidoreductase (nitroreductase family)
MPMPLWWGQINKRIFNPLALKGDKWSVIGHVGRVSGKPYRTPLEAFPVEAGFVFILVYGPKSDWVQNVLTAGHARLEFEDEDIELHSPRLISEAEAWKLLPAGTNSPPGFLKIDDYLRMDRAN